MLTVDQLSQYILLNFFLMHHDFMVKKAKQTPRYNAFV
jgi:hypothetical protein